MTRDRTGEFHVGYARETPPGLARFARRTAAGLLLLAAALGAGLALLLERFDDGTFAYGTLNDYSGELLVDPLPRLLTADGPAAGYLLVGTGKHGLDLDEEPGPPWPPLGATASELSGAHQRPPRARPSGASTRLSGTPIRNPKEAMLEVHSLDLPGRAASPRTRAAAAPPRGAGGSPSGRGRNDVPTAGRPAHAQVHGVDARLVVRGHRLVGEIVDTKCYLGAMKPGRGKPHRGCASLCIRGGIPAALLVRTDRGERELVYLVDFAGRPLGPELLEWVGQPVSAIGLLRRADDRLFLAIFDSRSIRAADGAGS